MIQSAWRPLLGELVADLSSLETLVSAVLFGSVARGEADAKSDLDLLLVLRGNKERKRATEIINQLSKKQKSSIQTIITDGQFSGLDRNFVENVFREGIIIYGKNLEVKTGKLQLEPFVLINYEASGCSLAVRNKLNRILYGYKTTKIYNKKKYSSGMEGLLKKYNGWKIGLATILVPFPSARIFLNLLKDNKVKIKKWEVWLPKV